MKVAIKLTRVVEALEVSAEEWQLYVFEVSASQEKQAKIAAKALNEAIMYAVNAGCSREETAKFVGKVQDKHGESGASDTEPDYVLAVILDKIYGKA